MIRRQGKPIARRTPIKRTGRRIRGRTEQAHVELVDGLVEAVLSSCHAASCVNVGATHMVRADAVRELRKRVFERAGGLVGGGSTNYVTVRMGRCEETGVPISWENFHMHEEQTRGKLGIQSMSNCRALSKARHNIKHKDRAPQLKWIKP